MSLRPNYLNHWSRRVGDRSDDAQSRPPTVVDDDINIHFMGLQMSDFPFDDKTDDEDDIDQTLPQSGVHPKEGDEEDDIDQTLPQSGVRSVDDDEDDFDDTLPQSGTGPSEVEEHSIGKYPVTRKLGQGGMGIVWLGHHPDLDIKVAVKTLPAHLISRDPAFIERFIKEARTAARINHANVVRIYDAGNDDDVYYIVMEYVDGGSVHELLKKDGAMPVKDALDIIIQVAEGLKSAAEFKIIHRDIKPENIMLDSKGTPKVADLGLAKQLDAEEMSMTGTGMAVGTPSYMAPEQVQDAKSCDARADIYSLGATFYHMITGKVPFTASSAFDMMLKHVQEPLPPPKEKNPDVPDNVNAVICKMLEKSPDLRYQTAEELLEDLNLIKYGDAPVKKLLAGKLAAVRPASMTAAPTQSTASAGSKKSILALVALACLAIAAVAGVMFKEQLFGKDNTPIDVVDNGTPDDDDKPPVDPKPVDPKPVDPNPVDPQPVDPKPVDPQPVDPKPVDPKPVDPKPVDPKPVDPKPIDPKPVDPKPVDPKPVKITPRLGRPTPLDLVGETQKNRVVESLRLTLVPLRAGSFTMGSNMGMSAVRPAHEVTLSRPFWMAATEVTASQFETFITASKYKTTAETVGFSTEIERTLKKTKRPGLSWKKASRGNQPVACVSRDDAQAFCNWLNTSQIRVLPVGYEYRLPTEAEWEYAARGGIKGAYGFDSLSEKLLSYAWYMENSRGKSQPVGTLKTNPWNLHDMHGNVSEWCIDAFDDYAKGAVVDPVKRQGPEFVVRGGSHVSYSEECEGTARLSKPSDYSATNVGFRVVLAPVLGR